MFTNPEVQIPSRVAAGLKVAGAFKLESRAIGSCQVRRTSHKPWNVLREHVQHFATAIARSHALVVSREGWKILVPSVGEFSVLHAVDPVRKLREFPGVFRERRLPLLLQIVSTLSDSLAEVFQHAIGNEKLRILGPAVILLGEPDFFLAQRLAVCFVGILFVRRSVSDVAVHDDQRGAVFGLEKIVISLG